MKGFVIVLALAAMLVATMLAAQANSSSCAMTCGTSHKMGQSVMTPTGTVAGLPTVNQVLRSNVGPAPSLAKAPGTSYSEPLGAGPTNADFYWNF